MVINENTSFTANIIVEDDNGNNISVASLYATLDKSNMNLSFSINTTDQTLANKKATDVKTQYTQFEDAVKARAVELGYPMFV